MHYLMVFAIVFERKHSGKLRCILTYTGMNVCIGYWINFFLWANICFLNPCYASPAFAKTFHCTTDDVFWVFLRRFKTIEYTHTIIHQFSGQSFWNSYSFEQKLLSNILLLHSKLFIPKNSIVTLYLGTHNYLVVSITCSQY